MMSLSHINLIISFLFISCFHVSAQENPFMDLAEKKYADYSIRLLEHFREFRNLTDTVEARKVICQIEEVAKKTRSMEWKLQAAYFEWELFRMKQSLYGEDLFPFAPFHQMRIDLLKKAERENVIPLELILRETLIAYYRRTERYDYAFEQCAIQAKRLEQVSAKDVPAKVHHLFQIADLYLFFKDYPKAIAFYKKVLEEETVFEWKYCQQQARNGIGLSFRSGYNNLDSSDLYFRAMLYFDNIGNSIDDHYDVYSGIAEGNLGHNFVLREEYDTAILYLNRSLEKMLKYEDYGYSTGVVANLANVYLHKGNIAKAKHYIDLARDYYKRTPREGMLSRIYEVLSKYYAATGNAKLSMKYMDSLLTENKRHQLQFNSLQIMTAEQRLHLSEQKLKEEELHAEKIKNDRFKRTLTITFALLLLIGGGFVRYVTLYRKKQAAYQELVRKSQEWAKVPVTSDELQVTSDELQHEAPDEADLLIMKEIEQAMQEDKLYKDTACSVNLVAKKLGAKRHYISNAINRCTNKSFSTYINEYRIKEAIQLLSKNDTHIPTIDAIAFNVGFNDRHVFYRVFKKMTGLSPTEFRTLA